MLKTKHKLEFFVSLIPKKGQKQKGFTLRSLHIMSFNKKGFAFYIVCYPLFYFVPS